MSKQNIHLGIIPDGHRRFARKNNISERRSYLLSQQRVTDIINKFDEPRMTPDELAIDSITLYAMSEENCKRDNEELAVFYDSLRAYFKGLLDAAGEGNYDTPFGDLTNIENQIHQNTNIGKQLDFNLDPTQYNIRFISTDLEPAPDDLVQLARRVENVYSDGQTSLNLLFFYSGQREITQALSKFNPQDDINPDELYDELQLSHDIDFVIRTGDNARRECLSGFALWQSAYTEYYHIQKNFPAITLSDIRKALEQYLSFRRNHGA